MLKKPESKPEDEEAEEVRPKWVSYPLREREAGAELPGVQ